jgi:hypothetical protein
MELIQGDVLEYLSNRWLVQGEEAGAPVKSGRTDSDVSGSDKAVVETDYTRPVL